MSSRTSKWLTLGACLALLAAVTVLLLWISAERRSERMLQRRGASFLLLTPDSRPLPSDLGVVERAATLVIRKWMRWFGHAPVVSVGVMPVHRRDVASFLQLCAEVYGTNYLLDSRLASSTVQFELTNTVSGQEAAARFLAALAAGPLEIRDPVTGATWQDRVAFIPEGRRSVLLVPASKVNHLAPGAP